MEAASRARSAKALLPVLAIGALVLLAACGGGADASSKVASLNNAASGSTTTSTTLSKEDVQKAWLSFAQCMRDNGVDMKDPTFDANGDVQGGLGRGSGIDFGNDATRTAMQACQQYLDVIRVNGQGPGGRNFDRTALQAAFNTFTKCLRDQGLSVDDVTLPTGPGGGPPDGGPTRSTIAGGTGTTVPGGAPGSSTDGSAPGFQGRQPNGGGNGQGFDPTARLIDRLGLDANDPAVTAALKVCQPALQAAFTPTTSTTQANK